MSTATTTYNNLFAEKSWKLSSQTSKSKEDTIPNAKFLVLIAQIEDIKKFFVIGSKVGKQSDTKTKSWRFSNPENKTEIEMNDEKYKWCSK